MSLLTVVQNAMVLTGLPSPSSVFSSTNDTVVQMKALLYKEGRELIREYDWNKSITVESLTCGASNAQTGYPVSGFARMADHTDVWNATKKQKIEGPANSGDWRDLITRTAVAYPQYWRLINGVLNIYPPTSGDTITYEYISKKWIYQAAGATLYETLAGDTDTFLFSEDLLEQGLVWRFKEAKQLDYAEDLRTYEIIKEQEKKHDRGGAKGISTSMAGRERPFRTWPGTVTP